jgi:hypothetical protein
MKKTVTVNSPTRNKIFFNIFLPPFLDFVPHSRLSPAYRQAGARERGG